MLATVDSRIRFGISSYTRESYGTINQAMCASKDVIKGKMRGRVQRVAIAHAVVHQTNFELFDKLVNVVGVAFVAHQVCTCPELLSKTTQGAGICNRRRAPRQHLKSIGFVSKQTTTIAVRAFLSGASAAHEHVEGICNLLDGLGECSFDDLDAHGAGSSVHTSSDAESTKGDGLQSWYELDSEHGPDMAGGVSSDTASLSTPAAAATTQPLNTLHSYFMPASRVKAAANETDARGKTRAHGMRNCGWAKEKFESDAVAKDHGTLYEGSSAGAVISSLPTSQAHGPQMGESFPDVAEDNDVTPVANNDKESTISSESSVVEKVKTVVKESSVVEKEKTIIKESNNTKLAKGTW